MSCGSRRDDVQKFCSAGTHFFKIILDDTLRDNKIQIPKRILNKCVSSLSSPVFLELPCGLRWEVGLTKCDGKVWMDKGWTDFSKFYSLSHGDLLVFKYKGNSQFHVLIFDKSTTEIDYPSNRCGFEKHGIDRKLKELKREEDDSVEILESVSVLCPKAREESPLPCSRPKKRIKINPVGKTQTNQSHHKPKEGAEKSLPPTSSKHEAVGRQRTNSKEKSQALRRASEFKSKDPFFMVSMRRTYVGAKCLLNIPYLFAKKYLINERGSVILKVPNGRTWSVQYSFGVYGINSKAKFEYGWKAFVKDNDLTVGDVCVFVLTESIRILFEVAIFRRNGIAYSSVLPARTAATSKVRQRRSKKTVTDNGQARAFQIASCFQSEFPFFTVSLRASYANSRRRFNIPIKFARTYVNKTEGDAILTVSDGRSWPVQYKVRDKINKSQAAEFCLGWPAFARDNNLEGGDICTFELTNGDDISFNVFIVKENDHLPQDASKFRTSEESTACQADQRPSSSRAIRASKAANSTNP